ncbi:hypothetical protein [Deinococcus malanensis]|uniref:hypothetical protein n=1 Tax=Deinococcus malanensis TaxID=1706855 RepID=UPI001668CB54|nr:hypothetical protein [Deinococcus malanensis]
MINPPPTPPISTLADVFDRADVVIPLPQGHVRAVVLPTELLAVHDPAVLLGLPEVLSARATLLDRPRLYGRLRPEPCYDEGLAVKVMAHMLAYLVRQPSWSGQVGQLRGRLTHFQMPSEWCFEQVIGLEVDTTAGPVPLELWTDPSWPGMLVLQPDGANLMCVGGSLPDDEAAGCAALSALLLGDRAEFDRCVTRGEVLPAALAP